MRISLAAEAATNFLTGLSTVTSATGLGNTPVNIEGSDHTVQSLIDLLLGITQTAQVVDAAVTAHPSATTTTPAS